MDKIALLMACTLLAGCGSTISNHNYQNHTTTTQVTPGDEIKKVGWYEFDPATGKVVHKRYEIRSRNSSTGTSCSLCGVDMDAYRRKAAEQAAKQ